MIKKQLTRAIDIIFEILQLQFLTNMGIISEVFRGYQFKSSNTRCKLLISSYSTFRIRRSSAFPMNAVFLFDNLTRGFCFIEACAKFTLC